MGKNILNVFQNIFQHLLLVILMKIILNKKLKKKIGLNMDYLKVLLLLLPYLVVFICIVVIDKTELRILIYNIININFI